MRRSITSLLIIIIASLHTVKAKSLLEKFPDARLANPEQAELTDVSMMTAKDERNAADGALRAGSKHIDSITANKFIEAYRKYFEKETSANLFNSKAEDSAVIKTRQKILDYIAMNQLGVKEEEIDKEWQTFLAKNYKDPKSLEKVLKDRYLNLDYVKNKFIENQDLTVYFNQVTSPRIKENIELRKKIFKLSKAKNIDYSKEEFNKALNQLVENLGGDEGFRKFLAENKFELIDIAFLIQTDLLREKISSALVNQDLENDLEISRNLQNSIKNHFYNFSLKNQAHYYFKQAFISKNTENAKTRITKARSNFNKLKNEDGIEVYEMLQPISEDSHLYNPKIRDAVLTLGKDPLFVSKEISPIIETDKGYHIVQIQKIELPEALSYQEAYADIYNKLVNNKYDEFSEMIDSYFRSSLDKQDLTLN